LNFQLQPHALTVRQQAKPWIVVPIIAAGRIGDDRHTAAHGAASGESLRLSVDSALNNARTVEEPLAGTDHSGQNREQNATNRPFDEAQLA
jgi:hypothetical protein